MTWPQDRKSAWVALALDDVAMTLAAKTRAPNAKFDRILPSLDLGDITPRDRDFKSQLQDEFDTFLDHIADREPDLEPEVMEWLITQWTALEDSPLSFKTRGGQLVVVASRDIPSRTHIKGLEDIVMFVGDEVAIDAEVTSHFTEWVKIEKKEQPFVWCGPFRLARRGCSSCSNTKWQKLKPGKGFPQHTVRQVLVATKPIKKGDVISCNFGIAETRQCNCEDLHKKGRRQTWASGGPGIPSVPTPKQSDSEERSARSFKSKSKSRGVTPASNGPHDRCATEMVLSLCEERPSSPKDQMTPFATVTARSSSPTTAWYPGEHNAVPYEGDNPMEERGRSTIDENTELPPSSIGYTTQEEDVPMDNEARPAKRKANDDSSTRRRSGKKMRMSTGGRMPRAVAPLEPMPKKKIADPPQDPATLPTPPYESSTGSRSSDAGGDDMDEDRHAQPEVTSSNSQGPTAQVVLRLPLIYKRPDTADAGVDAVPAPATGETSTQANGSGASSQDVAMSEIPATQAAAAAADALLARVAELETRTAQLETRNRTLLAANRSLRQGDSVTGSHSAQRIPEVPFALMLARKYREETLWRRKCLELVAVWADDNRHLQEIVAQLQGNIGQLRENNTRLVTENTQVNSKNASLRQTLEKLKQANQDGSNALASERYKVTSLIKQINKCASSSTPNATASSR